MSVMVDWFAVSFPDGVAVEDVKGLYGKDWTDAERGGLGYAKQTLCGNVRVYYEGQAGMGIHVEISGQGCREIEALAWFMDWASQVESVVDRKGHITRLDLAFDDKDGVLVPDVITRAIDEGRAVSRFKEATNIRKRRLVPDEETGLQKRTGWTEYFGAASSDVRIRFYDKAAQMEQEGAWVRAEIQFRRDRAHAAGELIRLGKIDEMVSILRGYVEFKDFPQGTDSNRRRWPVAGWWEQFCEGAAKARLQVAPKERSLETMWTWLEKSVAPTLAAFNRIWGGDMAPLFRLMVENDDRVNSGAAQLVKEYQAEQARKEEAKRRERAAAEGRITWEALRAAGSVMAAPAR